MNILQYRRSTKIILKNEIEIPSAIISSTVTVNLPTVKTFPIKVFGSLLHCSPLAVDLENNLFILMDIVQT